MPAEARALVERLLPWFAQHARTLPWRSVPTGYRVLLSELMLQQTRVDTVLPYFERFTTRWPTLADLAAASEEEVLQAWSGLGYYARARNLLACARAATEQGGLPQRPEALRKLPGIGPYTAGAVASIAFGIRAPLVDGNVERVLSRVDGLTDDPRKAVGRRALWGRASALQAALGEGEAPGDLNQALMELGATVCVPRAPRCPECPLQEVCVAARAGEPERYPTRRAKAPPRPISGVSGLCQLAGGLVMGQRPTGGLLGGLWEPIGATCDPEDEPAATLAGVFAERAGIEVQIGPSLGQVVHVFTHRRLTARVFRVTRIAGRPRARSFYTQVRVVREPEAVALSTLARKVLALQDGHG